MARTHIHRVVVPDLFSTSVRVNFRLALMDQGALIGMLLVQITVIGVGTWLACNGSLTVGTLAAFQEDCSMKRVPRSIIRPKPPSPSR